MELGHLFGDSFLESNAPSRAPPNRAAVPCWTSLHGNFELTPRRMTDTGSIRWNSVPECPFETCDAKTPPFHQDPKEQVVGKVQNLRPAPRRPGSIVRSKPAKITSYTEIRE